MPSRQGAISMTPSNPSQDLRTVAASFQIQGSFIDARPYGSGHINDTFVAAFSQAGTRVRYIFQRINHLVFKNPAALMENIERVTTEAHTRLFSSGIPDTSRRALTIIPTHEGLPFFLTPEGNFWRCYLFIEGARTYDIIENDRQAFEAARAFGEFQKLIAGLSGPRLHETIPQFHHTRSRFENLRTAAQNDPHGRLKDVQAEWDFIQSCEADVDVLLDLQARGAIPERITHNDTKLNNVMIDDTTESAICVIDLDTLMPGLALYDFGDLVRTATNAAAEDELDLSKVHMQLPMFKALVRGYLAATRDMLNEAEIEHLAFSGKLISLEIGMRFLTDHLQGDVYFKIKRPNHNLDRARTQVALVQSISAQMNSMQQAVRQLSA